MPPLIVVAGVAGIGLVLSLAVLVTALQPLETVIRTVEDDVPNAFWTGLVAQLLAVPVLAVGAALLAVTIVGVLLVPLLAVAWTLAIAGAATLGLVAVICVIGRSRMHGDSARSRQGLLRALTIGTAFVWAPWFLAAGVVSVPGLGLTARLLAVALTWGAMTVGLGAVVRSRGARQLPRGAERYEVTAGRASTGTGSGRAGGASRGVASAGGRADARGSRSASPVPVWQTPTPVAGVVAARRPAPSDPTALDAD